MRSAMARALHIFVCAGLVFALQAAATAQAPSAPAGTRAETLQRAREEKQESVTPYEPNAAERAMSIVENRALPLLVRDGVHAKFGSLTTGSGFAYGVGYRNRRVLDREGSVNFWIASSLKKYWAAEARFDMPSLADDRLMLGAYARRQRYPQEDFFGVGPASRREDHTAFQFDSTRVGGRASVRAAPSLVMGGSLEYLRDEIGSGRNAAVPSIEARFDALTAPGLAGARTFVRPAAFVEYDYREPRNARRGGLYRLEASRFHDRSDAFTFTRVDLDLRQYASVLAERRVLAVRLFASTSDPAPGANVPFYLMPALGGHDSLRGFRDYRFRGPHAILTQTEYRFEAWSGLDAALFYDAGKVELRRSALNFKGLESAYGFGFRFNTDNGTILRIDAGFGSREGKHLYIVFGDVF
jgi:hypothetical protein